MTTSLFNARRMCYGMKRHAIEAEELGWWDYAEETEREAESKLDLIEKFNQEDIKHELEHRHHRKACRR